MSEITIEHLFKLAVQHHQAGRLHEAEQLYRQVLARQPGHVEALHNLGMIAQQAGRNDIAIDLFRRVIALWPNSAEAHFILGNVLTVNGQLGEAIVAYRQAIAINPNYAEAYNNLGNALKSQGEFDLSIAALGKAIWLKPDFPEAQINLGNAFKAKGQFQEAIAAYRRSIALKPDDAKAYNNLGNALSDNGQFDEAIATYRQAIQIRPNFAEGYNNLGNVLKETGQLDEAIAAYRQAIALNPQSAFAHSNLVYTQYFHPKYEAQTIREEACRWNEVHARPLANQIRSWSNDPDPDRQLRIGYVSPNLREHTNGFAMLPLLKAHDHSRYHIICYSDTPRPDSITEQCRNAVDEWRNIVGLSNERVSEQVRQDRIDILVDLVSHMGSNRLLVFARKPAPVQVTYLGHQGTTGMTTMDYRLSDPHIDPPGPHDADYTEKIIRVPDCYLCFQPLPDSPEVKEPPALRAGYVTFGSLNNFCKITPGVLNLWSRILTALPGSRLILRCPAGESLQRVLHFFAGRGIDSSRLSVGPHWMKAEEYLQFHDQIDVYLDPFPHTGHTTSMDALWMGVPVVTLAGQTAVGKGGVFLLVNLGLEELIAHNEQEYLEKAVGLATDLPKLQHLRSTLRQRMEQSPLMDAPKFARNIEAAYRGMWRKWCETKSHSQHSE